MGLGWICVCQVAHEDEVDENKRKQKCFCFCRDEELLPETSRCGGACGVR